MWPSDTLPTGYHLCDGSSLNISDYPELYKVLGTTYGGSGTSFKLPNIQGSFVAGKGANDYNTLGATGGANKVALGISEMPKHNHNSSSSTSDGEISISGGEHAHKGAYKSFQDKGDRDYGYPYITQSGDNGTHDVPWNVGSTGEHSHKVKLYARGGGNNGATVAHENRPPFIVLNYIIKVK